MTSTTTSTTKKPPVRSKVVKPDIESVRFASIDDIRLGMTVKDPASGLIGIANMKAELISGSVQYAIQPVGDGKSMPEGFFVDDFMLEFVDDGVSKRAPAPDAAARFVLGEDLQDTISGFRGIAVQRTTYLNGCVHYTLQPEERRKSLVAKLVGEPSRSQHFDHKALKKLGAGAAPAPKKIAAPKIEKPAETPVFKRSPTGGPTRSVRAAGF
jgi:hypothetical protein